MKQTFKPTFNGYMKLYLYDNDLNNLINRMEIMGDWRTKRSRILKKERRFMVTLHIFDKDGHKCGLETFYFKSRGDDKELSHAIFKVGNEFVNELRSSFDVDLTSSYAVVRV